MSRITPVPYQRRSRAFELAGFKLVRQEGDHRVYTKPGITRPIVIPIYGRTNDGRYLLVALRYRGRGVARVVTARDMTESEKGLYHKKRR